MLIIPAIDIQDGCVVRFVQGRLNKKTYSHDPLKTAKHWARQGAKLIHVVDLDGANSGRPKNIAIVKQIAADINVPIEFGGGVRDIATIKSLLGAGVYRVVLGTKAAQEESFLKKAFKMFKDKIIVSIDARDKSVLVKGWRKSLESLGLFSFANSLKEAGFRELIYTDTLKDGTLRGPNIKAIKALLKSTGMKIIASGGISSLEDIDKLRALERAGVSGVIIGKALYEGRFTLPEALKLA